MRVDRVICGHMSGMRARTSVRYLHFSCAVALVLLVLRHVAEGRVSSSTYVRRAERVRVMAPVGVRPRSIRFGAARIFFAHGGGARTDFFPAPGRSGQAWGQHRPVVHLWCRAIIITDVYMESARTRAGLVRSRTEARGREGSRCNPAAVLGVISVASFR